MFHVEHHLLSIVCFSVKISYIITRKETNMTYTHLLFDMMVRSLTLMLEKLMLFIRCAILFIFHTLMKYFLYISA